MPDSAFTVDLGSITARCERCGRRYDLNGTLRAVSPDVDAEVDGIEVPLDGCPECEGEKPPETVAAE